jgi:hypothetical protein
LSHCATYDGYDFFHCTRNWLEQVYGNGTIDKEAAIQ